MHEPVSRLLDMETESRMPVIPMSTIDGQGIFQTMTMDRPSCMFTISPQSSPSTPEDKFYNVMKENVREMVCKRRLDFNSHETYLGLTKPPTVAVERRNERERNRVKLINMTFATLREHIPAGGKNGKSKKMSKVDTLKAAIDYIRYLQQLVDEHDAVNAVLDSNCLPKSAISPASPSVHSPTPSTSSETSHEILSAEEEELLDFTNWF
ncbi:achaete-scute homolog 1b-like [Mizuhopecten yessoensis]|uniref:Achaete-scute-like 1 n=1 Tax=Mizuhopecten yessoensis TaxID=6573 RepID=A0A210QG34_MIZYE|nr:achaete-scute homolog 1b-like [Mizuhopecten yessoensis]OWF47581.1 Achaete-scute-like 1 [Mizuhopecten yessoensis]